MQHRRSVQRDKILKVLQETKVHPTADWIYQQLKDEIPSLSLGTVYRNLKVLIEQKLVQRIPFGSDQDRFEATIAPHYHLVCENCGTVEDFEMPQHPDINQNVEKMTSFKISHHRIDFFGLCKNCQNSPKQQPKRKGK